MGFLGGEGEWGERSPKCSFVSNLEQNSNQDGLKTSPNKYQKNYVIKKLFIPLIRKQNSFCTKI